MLNSKIKVQKKDGKENIKHKPAIPPGDLRKLSASGVIHGGTPLGLLRYVWFDTSLYWCRRGREGQRKFRADSFVLEVGEDCRPYGCMNGDQATKNHPGGIVDVQSSKNFGRMYQTSSDPNLDGLSCLKKYISKRNASCEAFFQYPKWKGAEESDVVWYENRPLGMNKLQSMMRDISKAAALSQIYTKHSVRATVITLWSDAQISSHDIMNISGHCNEESIKSTTTRGLHQVNFTKVRTSCPRRVPHKARQTLRYRMACLSVLQNHSSWRLFLQQISQPHSRSSSSSYSKIHHFKSLEAAACSTLAKFKTWMFS